MSVVEFKVAPVSLWFVQVCFIGLLLTPLTSGYDWQSYVKNATPFFDDITKRDFVARIGQTLVLPCTVRNLRGKVVSWIRSKDLQILTSGVFTFTGDFRFEPVHTESSGDFWGLRMRGVKQSDAGRYECQVNTDPKMSLAIELSVTVPGALSGQDLDAKWTSRASINGPEEIFVQSGSPVTLTCEITPVGGFPSSSIPNFVPDKPAHVWWLHGAEQIIPNITRRGVIINTSYPEEDKRIVRSTIFFEKISRKDVGEYSCAQPSTKQATIKVVVVEAETSEAMQRDYPMASRSTIFSQHIAFSILSYLSTKVFV